MDVRVYPPYSGKGNIQFKEEDESSISWFDELFTNCFNSAADRTNDLMHEHNHYRSQRAIGFPLAEEEKKKIEKNLRPIKFPLVEEERKKIEKDLSKRSIVHFLDFGPNDARKACLIKVRGYFLKKCATGALYGGAFGAVLGGTIGGVVPGAAPGTIVAGVFGGMFVGAVVGAGFMLTIAQSDKELVIEERKKYQKWIAEKAKEPIRKRVSELCQTYFPAELLCPISLCVPALPVMLRERGPIYEKHDLEAFMNKNLAAEQSLKKDLRREGKTERQVKKAVRKFRKNNTLPGEEYIKSTEQFIIDERVFVRIEAFAAAKLRELNDLGRELPLKALRRCFVALVENKERTGHEKMDKIEAKMAKYGVSEIDQERIRVRLKESLDNSV